jgi:hypothetical protein
MENALNSVQLVAAEPRGAVRAVGLGAALLRHAASSERVVVAASIVTGPVVALGAGQVAGRVLDLEACRSSGTTVVRRATSGTAAWLEGRALWLSIALPNVAAIVADASPRTLLNRNVRPLLAGLRSLGVRAAYFGREHVAVGKRPGPLLGYEAREDGAVLLDVIVGWDASVALPVALAAETERATDRARGQVPIALAEVAGGRSLDDLGDRLLRALAAGAPIEPLPEAALAPIVDAPIVDDARDPIPPGLASVAPRPCPIGWIDAAVGAAGVWLGGDGLVPAFVRARVADAASRRLSRDVGAAPLDGLTLDDLASAAEAALAVTTRAAGATRPDTP